VPLPTSTRIDEAASAESRLPGGVDRELDALVGAQLAQHQRVGLLGQLEAAERAGTVRLEDRFLERGEFQRALEGAAVVVLPYTASIASSTPLLARSSPSTSA
jgi:hypothetical protein